MTLSELLISIVILSFMMGGIFATDYAVRSMSTKVTDDITLTMQLRSMSEHIRRDALSSTGELGDLGITLTASRMCFRIDSDVPATPGDYSDDTWNCYTLLVNNLYKCPNLAAPANCTAADILIGTLITNAFSTAGTIPTFTNGHFYLKLQTRKLPAVAMDVNDNPQAEVEISVYPVGHSSL